MHACLELNECRAWSFSHRSNVCQLKADVPKKVFAVDMSCGLGQVSMLPQVRFHTCFFSMNIFSSLHFFASKKNIISKYKV